MVASRGLVFVMREGPTTDRTFFASAPGGCARDRTGRPGAPILGDTYSDGIRRVDNLSDAVPPFLY